MNLVQQSKIDAELQFWNQWMRKLDYAEIREEDYRDKTKFFSPEITEETGLGLDLGCGPDSVFEHSAHRVIACDALMNQYPVSPLRKRVTYMEQNAEKLTFEDGQFDWVFCINMIDHTPNPEQVIQEIKRVLCPGGRLYFEVHFDPALFAPHYTLWRHETVVELVNPHFTHVRSHMEWCPQWTKYIYWGLYTR